MSKPKVHYLHFRKCGGTAFKNVVKEHLTAGKYEIILHGHDTILEDVPEGEKVIFFLRDPISKFVSGFYDRKREGRPGYYFPHWEHEKRLFKIFNTPNELGEALSDEADEELKKQAIEAMSTIPHIMNSYWEWLHSPVLLMSRKEDILYIGHQETFKSDFENLLSILELPSSLTPSKNPTTANSAPENEDKYLSELARKNLIRWYEVDYKVYEVLRRMGFIEA